MQELSSIKRAANEALSSLTKVENDRSCSHKNTSLKPTNTALAPFLVFLLVFLYIFFLSLCLWPFSASNPFLFAALPFVTSKTRYFRAWNSAAWEKLLLLAYPHPPYIYITTWWSCYPQRANQLPQLTIFICTCLYR